MNDTLVKLREKRAEIEKIVDDIETSTNYPEVYLNEYFAEVEERLEAKKKADIEKLDKEHQEKIATLNEYRKKCLDELKAEPSRITPPRCDIKILRQRIEEWNNMFHSIDNNKWKHLNAEMSVILDEMRQKNNENKRILLLEEFFSFNSSPTSFTLQPKLSKQLVDNFKFKSWNLKKEDFELFSAKLLSFESDFKLENFKWCSNFYLEAKAFMVGSYLNKQKTKLFFRQDNEEFDIDFFDDNENYFMNLTSLGEAVACFHEPYYFLFIKINDEILDLFPVTKGLKRSKKDIHRNRLSIVLSVNKDEADLIWLRLFKYFNMNYMKQALYFNFGFLNRSKSKELVLAAFEGVQPQFEDVTNFVNEPDAIVTNDPACMENEPTKNSENINLVDGNNVTRTTKHKLDESSSCSDESTSCKKLKVLN